jgi:gamma-glutamylcyclotransferase (GGCT)/AIG2-like uncharacterized protein YtfP
MPLPLFVYGTLRRGCDNPWAAKLHAASHYEGPATIAGSLYRIAHYPGLVEDLTTGPVKGELWRPREFDKLIAQLDDYEGRDYQRVNRTVTTPAGEPVSAWVYLFVASIEGKPRIESGDWIE